MIGRRTFAFLLDWRNLATLLATVLVALTVVTYVDNVRSRVEATSSLKAEVAESAQLREAATRRIDELSRQIQQLQADLDDAREGRAAIKAQLDALIVQIRHMGGEPVVTPAPSSGSRSTSPSPSPSPSPSHKPSPKPTHKPSSHPSPTCTPLPVIGCR